MKAPAVSQRQMKRQAREILTGLVSQLDEGSRVDHCSFNFVFDIENQDNLATGFVEGCPTGYSTVTMEMRLYDPRKAAKYGRWFKRMMKTQLRGNPSP